MRRLLTSRLAFRGIALVLQCAHQAARSMFSPFGRGSSALCNSVPLEKLKASCLFSRVHLVMVLVMALVCVALLCCCASADPGGVDDAQESDAGVAAVQNAEETPHAEAEGNDASSSGSGTVPSADDAESPTEANDGDSSASVSEAPAPSSADGDAEALENSESSMATDDSETPVTYPTGWLAVQVEDVPAGVPVRILHLPDMDVSAHRAGQPVSAQEQAQLDEQIPTADGWAIIEHDGTTYQVDPVFLLVNLPDVLPQACYDVVYSYASTSNCAGMEIPGVTGQCLNGYSEGKQENAYWSHEEFVVPCAYATACKARAVCSELDQQGYRLLVFDAYRPMAAQWQLSDAFQQAYAENPSIAVSLGEWSTTWYVAQGASGHNYGTDLDVGVCDQDGDPIPMPSSFDAFDESGHLTYAPMDAGAITPESYRDAVVTNDACMVMHLAFRNAGFIELASEWWHFSDMQTEADMRAMMGDGGLDFVVTMS